MYHEYMYAIGYTQSHGCYVWKYTVRPMDAM